MSNPTGSGRVLPVLARPVIDEARDAIVARGSVRAAARRWSDVVHRWLALTVGAILVITGVTGSLLAFYIEIERTLYPHMRTAHPHALPISYEAVYQRLVHLSPVDPPGGTWSIEIPPDGGVITSRRYYSAPPGKTAPPPRMVTLDPVTLEVLRDAHWNDTFFTWIYDLHMYLQIGATGTIGQTGMGIAALLMLVMFFAGLGNWLLPPGTLRAKFRLRWNKTTRARRMYDAHKLIGGCTIALLTLTVATGALISLPDQVRATLNRFSPLKPAEPSVRSTLVASSQRIALDKIIAHGLAYFPGSRVVWVDVPMLPTGTYDLEIRQAGAPMTRFPRTHLYLDQYSGAVLAVYDPKRDDAGDTILNWLVPLHDGKAFGLVGRVWVMLLGLVPIAMVATGFARWRQKRAARNAAVGKRLVARSLLN